MISVSLGPVALPVAPLCLAASAWLAARAARWAAGAQGSAAEAALWLALGVALVGARLGHVALNWSAYDPQPWSMLDLRDGGWHVLAGAASGLLTLAWRAWRPADPPVPSPGQPARPAAAANKPGSACLRGLAFGALVGLSAWSASRQLWPPLPSDMGTARSVELRAIGNGRVQELAELLGDRPTVINLWATWCGPCRAEMPVFAAASRRQPQVRFLFVNQGESAEAIMGWLARERLELHEVWLDPSAALGRAIGSSGLPTTLFFDRQGQLVDAHFGMLNAAALQARLGAIDRR